MTIDTLSRPKKTANPIKRVAILFAGGPAPAANAVISSAAISFIRNGAEVIGIKHGYSALMEYDGETPLVEGQDYILLTEASLDQTRAKPGIMIGTARANPGKSIQQPSDFQDADKTAALQRTYNAMRSLDVDAFISIGGDDTLKTANKFQLFQKHLGDDQVTIPVVHLPKTIDNDYMGIDFTFGFFTAVDFLATEIRNLNCDAAAGRAYFLCEAMGRSAGWLAYGAAMAGEASLVISVEDIVGVYATQETITNEVTGESETRKIMDMPALVGRMVRTMVAREEQGKEFGVIVVAEGLAEFLPYSYLAGIPRDDHGHLAISEISLGKILTDYLSTAYTEATGKHRKINGLQLGYESRCSQPVAFDIMLGSQLGVGAYRALAEQQLNGVMVSISGQLDLEYVPFEQLVDPNTLVTVVRYIETNSDFHKLARFLEPYID
jgi:6-phosphofructokinase 1